MKKTKIHTYKKNGWQLFCTFAAATLLNTSAMAEFDYINENDEPRASDPWTPYELPIPTIGPADRIGWAADGNNNDPDDWCASPVALCIIAASGKQDQFVHFSYNNRLDRFKTVMKAEQKESVMGAAIRFGFDTSMFYDLWESDINTLEFPPIAQRPGHAAIGKYPEYDAAFESAIEEVLASSDSSRFFWIQAGPFEFAYRVLQEAKERGATAENLRNTVLVSHSGINEQPDKWNELDLLSGNARDAAGAEMCVEDFGAGFYFTGAQYKNRFGSKTNMEAWDFVEWMATSPYEAYQWMYGRFEVFTEFHQLDDPDQKGLDASDAGMAYAMLARDYNGNLAKFSSYVADYVPPGDDLDVTAPTPNPSVWASTTATDTTITMTAVTANDPSDVFYFFQWKTGADAWTNSGWITDPSVTATDLTPDSEYTLYVITRDSLFNMGAWSSQTKVTTLSNAVDTQPPTPNPSEWVSASALSATAIEMQAVEAEDPNGVEYSFYGLKDGVAAFWSGWISDSTYTAENLEPATEYKISVRTRDGLGNGGSWSSAAVVTTLPDVDTEPPTPNPSEWVSASALNATTIEMQAVTAEDPSGVEYSFFGQVDGVAAFWSGWISESTYTKTGLESGTTYTLWLQTRDGQGNAGSWSSAKVVTTF